MPDFTPRCQYALPGLIIEESSGLELRSRSITEAVARAPEGAYAFTLYDLPVPDFDFDAELFRVVGKAQRRSGRIYIDGPEVTILGRSDIPAGATYSTLRANAEANDFEQLIKHRQGGWQPFTEADSLVDENGVVLRGPGDQFAAS